MRSALVLIPALALLGCGSMSSTRHAARSSVQYVQIVPDEEDLGEDHDTVELAEVSTARGSANGRVYYEPIHDGAPSTYASRTSARPSRPRALTHDHDHDHGHDRGATARQRPSGDHPVAPGIVVPYPTDRFFRGFGACRRDGRHHHEAIDLGGVGPNWGIGTPIVSMTRAVVEFIGTGEDDPGEFGTPEKRKRTVIRGRTELPTSEVVEGYGRVWYFTRRKGRWRSGTVVVTRTIGGPLDGHRIRYMHLGAVHPSLTRGGVVEAGQEIGLMGGTGVQESAPHVHIDIQDPDGRRVDVAPLIGLPPTARDCGAEGADTELAEAPARQVAAAVAAAHADEDADDHDDDPSRSTDPRIWSKRVELPACGTWSRAEDFASGRYDAHDVQVHVGKGDKIVVDLEREAGRWSPRIEVRDAAGEPFGRTSVRARRPPVTTKIVRTGQKGGRATLVVEARAEADVTVRVTAWPPRRGAEPVPVPVDARYNLAIEARCPKR